MISAAVIGATSLPMYSGKPVIGSGGYHPCHGFHEWILPYSDRNFNRTRFEVIKVRTHFPSVILMSRNKKKDRKTLILKAFQSKCPLFKFGAFFVVLKYICLISVQIYADFYFNYIIYSGLLILCCQNVAKNSNFSKVNIFFLYVGKYIFYPYTSLLITFLLYFLYFRQYNHIIHHTYLIYFIVTWHYHINQLNKIFFKLFMIRQ